MIPPPRNALVSYHYFRTYDLDRLTGLRLIGDSGAYSAASQGATITTKDLAGWARQWAHRFAWVASLDVIGDPVGTRANWCKLVDVHGIAAVPTIHFGADPALMDFYATRGVDFLGLGGMVGFKSSKTRLLRWIVACMRYARDHHPGMRFHGWGVTAVELMRAPFFSVDSSGWAAGVIFGRLTVSDPNSLTDYKIDLNGRDVYRPAVARLLRDHYGIRPADIARSYSGNRETVIRACALSASVAEQRMRRLHGTITAPRWGAGILVDHTAPTADGPHQHILSTKNDSLAEVAQMGDGPHQHIVTGGPTSNTNLEFLADGPHLHLATAAPKTEASVLAELAQKDDTP
jgi:hypothetical protein